MRPPPERIELDHPAWMAGAVDWDRPYPTDAERMQLAVDLSRENVERCTGGPFGAAIFEAGSGRLVSVGVNSVVRLHNCTLHAEMVAFMMAQHRAGSFTLAEPGMPQHELFTSCEPCAMCLGAALWSGVSRIVFGATGADVRNLGFDEGPVFEQSHEYLAARGVRIEGGLLRDEAAKVLERYRELQGTLYNRIPAV
jgi:tRNA(Arg) A34 adenosine deaminase TadA